MIFSRQKGIVFCLIAGLTWGTIGIFVKKVTGVSPIGIACFRLLIAACCMIILISCMKGWNEVKRSFGDWKYFLPLSFLMSFHFFFSTTAFTATTVANASILNITFFLFVPLFAFFIDEKTNMREILGILIGFLGIYFIFSTKGLSFSSQYFFGNLAALLAAILLAIYTVSCRRIRVHYSSLTIMIWIFGGAGIFLLLESFIFQKPLILVPTFSDWYFLIGLGVVGTFVAHTLFNTALKYIKSSVASMLSLTSPVSATLYASILLSEFPPFLTIIGLLFITSGILLVILQKNS